MITSTMRNIRDKTDYISPSVHWEKRAFDKAYEIVATLTPDALAELDLNIGGEICLHVAKNRQDALEAVRFFRYQENANAR